MKKLLLYLAIFGFVVLLTYLFIGICPQRIYVWRARADAGLLIREVEEFWEANGRYPVSILEIRPNWDSGDNLYYRNDSDGYEIWFGVGYGEFWKYQSETEKWSYGG